MTFFKKIAIFFSCFLLGVAQQACDRTKCPGPLLFYEEMECEPSFKYPEDCCPIRYNCSHLETRTADKCYASGTEYKIGEELPARDCLAGCKCMKGDSGFASFNCAMIECPMIKRPAHCYVDRSKNKCCGDVVCPDAKTPTQCKFENVTYEIGRYFTPSKYPDIQCYCLPVEKGKNTSGFFCSKIFCNDDVHHSSEIQQKCVPVYHGLGSLVAQCAIEYKCPKPGDEVIKTNQKNENNSDDLNKCSFGDLTLNIGDELKSNGTDTVFCKCEVPPMLTCRRRPMRCGTPG